MIFFFDRSIGKAIPHALRRLKVPIEVEIHDERFAMDAPDDEWLPEVGTWGWFVIGQDSKYHTRPNELAAIKQFEVGVFYLGGGTATKWDTMRVFARAYDKIMDIASSSERPFIYRVHRTGHLTEVPLP